MRNISTFILLLGVLTNSWGSIEASMREQMKRVLNTSGVAYVDAQCFFSMKQSAVLTCPSQGLSQDQVRVPMLKDGWVYMGQHELKDWFRSVGMVYQFKREKYNLEYGCRPDSCYISLYRSLP
jgi:hypothetical protein